jgi:signal transduction histidine kinase
MAPLQRPIAWLKAHPFAADVLLAALLTMIMLPTQWLDPPSAEGIDWRGPDVLGALLAVLTAAPIAWRRRWPMSVLVVTAVAAVAYEVLGYATSIAPFGLLVALYTVAAHCDRARSRLAALLVAVGLGIVLLTARWEVNLGTIISNFVVFGTAWVIGDNLKTRRAFVASLHERAERAEQTRVAEAERAVAEERTRIARELHDVVAHSMSVMVVQAGAARRVLDREPDRAAEALQAIETTGREALTEMRRLLGVLRDQGEARPELAPQPTIDGIGSLVEHFADAGLPVTLERFGVERELPAGIGLSAYRIVQEGLTNALKHAGPDTRVEVKVRYRDDDIEVEVLDDGRGVTSSPPDGSGHGLVGMRERVDVCGGDLKAGPRPGGGFAVRARLPVAVEAR